METNKLDFWDFVKANRGNKKYIWKVVKAFETKIKRVSGGNEEMENEIIVNVCKLLNDLDEKYEKYFKSING